MRKAIFNQTIDYDYVFPLHYVAMYIHTMSVAGESN